MDLMKLKSGSDIRGVALGDAPTLTPEIAEKCAAAFAVMLRRKTQGAPRVAVGGDPRLSSPALRAAAEKGLCGQGCEVLSCGGATTPSMFFATQFADCDGAIEITASHLPQDRNGLKFFTRDGGLEAEDVEKILTLAPDITPAGNGSVAPFDIMTPYAAHLCDLVRRHAGSDTPLAGKKIIVNAGNGMGGFFATDVLAPLGADVSGSVNLTPDGTFPVHIPNPESKPAMQATSEAAKAAGAVLGICFDTDCDRAAVVDGTGREINSDRLIALIGAILLGETPGGTIVTDSVTDSGLRTFLEAKGGHQHRFKRGYKNVINEAKRLEAQGVSVPLAIETSGHAALKENGYLDDGAYLAVRILCALADGKEPGEIIRDLPEPAERFSLRITITEPDFRAYGQKVIDEFGAYLARLGTPEEPNFEGVRANFGTDAGDGWLMMRLSVHDPVLPVDAASRTPGGCAVMKRYLDDFIKKYDGLKV